jgi:hypothetical protein
MISGRLSTPVKGILWREKNYKGLTLQNKNTLPTYSLLWNSRVRNCYNTIHWGLLPLDSCLNMFTDLKVGNFTSWLTYKICTCHNIAEILLKCYNC